MTEDEDATLHFPADSAVIVIHANGDIEMVIPSEEDPNAEVQSNVMLAGAVLNALSDEQRVTELLNEFRATSQKRRATRTN